MGNRRMQLGPPVAWLAGLVGLLLGVLLNRFNANVGAYEVLAASLGAAIAVVGAVIAADYREKAGRRELQHIIRGSVLKLRQMAQRMEFVTEIIDDSKVEGPDAVMKRFVLLAHGHWRHLAMFSPYDRVGDYKLANALAEIDLIAIELPALLEEPPPRVSGGSSSFMFARMVRPVRSKVELERLGGRMRAACDDALALLGGPDPDHLQLQD